ncbi:MAG TPA: RodZ domain-containing protein [Terriglobales bacterium]|nr:RodZ domain-containing protein [Terriglobales bacterium]
MQGLGQRLKKEREKQAVTLDEVCVSTKVAVRFLQAIEAEQFEKLPGGIFNKGFIRAYAQHLGVDDNAAVADYLEATGLQPTVPLNTTPPGEKPYVDDEVPQARLITIPEVKKEVKLDPKAVAPPPQAKPVVAALEQKPAAVVVQNTPPRRKNKAARAHARQEQARQEQARQAQARQVPVRQELPRQEPVRQELEKKKSVQPAKVAAPVLAPVATDEHWFPWGKVAFALLLIAFGFAMWGSFHRDVEDHNGPPAPPPVASQSAAVPVPQAAVPAIAAPDPAAAAAGSFQVVVQARENSWVSIVADGKEVMQEVLDASAQKAVEAHKEVIIKAGNIGALDFVFNGKKLPSQGGYDEVKTLTFDPNGLQSQPVKTAGL